MTKLKKLSSLALTTAVALFGMALTASTAQAAIITFGVEEGAVPGANNTNPVGPELLANGLTAKYRELVTLGPGNTFTGSILVLFSQYTIGGTTVPSQIGAPGTDTPSNQYVLYGLVTVSGTFTQQDIDTDLSGTADTTFTFFKPTTATANIYVDPSRDDTGNYTVPSVNDPSSDDLKVLTATAITGFPTSNGLVTVDDGTGEVTGGKYALVFTDPTLTAFGSLYWPDLEALGLTFAIASGDVDPTAEGSIFPTDIKGDSSISFLSSTPVPEPTSLFLLGSGLMGVAGWRRRRAATK